MVAPTRWCRRRVAMTTTTVAVQATPRSDRRRWWALVVVCLGMFMNSLDSCVGVGTVVALVLLRSPTQAGLDADRWLETEAEVASGPFAS